MYPSSAARWLVERQDVARRTDEHEGVVLGEFGRIEHVGICRRDDLETLSCPSFSSAVTALGIDGWAKPAVRVKTNTENRGWLVGLSSV